MKTLIIVVIALLGWSEVRGAKWPEKDGRPCKCSRLHRPVCGHDNVDYPNPACAQSCGNVRGYRMGTCDSPALCGCTFEYAQVCARRPDGTLDTFDNRCQAECDTGATVVHEGECGAHPDNSLPSLAHLSQHRSRKSSDDNCICTLEYEPVCGLKDRKWTTYGNECGARCAGVERFRRGPCGTGKFCPCPRIYSPVCASKDGRARTYANICEADCAEAVVEQEDHCNVRPDNSLPGRKLKAKRTDINYDCVCTRELNPTCALKNGQWKTYSNPCMTRCGGAPEKIKPGRCPEAAQLPVFPDSEDLDLDVSQLPWFQDSSEEDEGISEGEDLVASQLPVFPELIKKFFL